jgi:hypothetical protein
MPRIQRRLASRGFRFGGFRSRFLLSGGSFSSMKGSFLISVALPAFALTFKADDSWHYIPTIPPAHAWRGPYSTVAALARFGGESAYRSFSSNHPFTQPVVVAP